MPRRAAPAREGGRGSRSGTDELNTTQGSRDSPSISSAPVPPPASRLHFCFRPTTQARPAYRQSRAGAAELQFRPKPASSGHVAAFLRANRSARSTPGSKPHPPQGSEWLSPGGAGEQETANGRCEAGSRPGAPRKSCSGGATAAGGARELVTAARSPLSAD